MSGRYTMVRPLSEQVSRFSYLPYLAIVYYVDQSDEFRLSQSNLAGRFACDVQAMRDAAKRYAKHLEGAEYQNGPLFDVAALRSFGHTDTVMLMICDGFDPLFTISQNSEISFEQMSLAFCPDLTALQGVDSSALRWFETPEDFVRATTNSPESSLPLDDTPLQLIVRFKVNGAAKLLSGTDITATIATKIVNTTAEVVEDVYKNAGNEDLKRCLGDSIPKKMELEDLPFRCSILDTQGVAELTVVMRCNNYTLPSIVLSHLRHLTLSDLYQVSPRLAQDAKGLEHHLRKHIPQALDGTTVWSEDKQPLNGFPGNHVFASSYSTACVTNDALEKDRSKVCGTVEAELSLVINPGHLTTTDELQDIVPDSEAVPWPLQDFYRIRLGKFDSECRIGLKQMFCLPTKDFLKSAHRAYERVHELGLGLKETGLSDLSHVVSVPIPKSIAAVESESEHYPLSRMLTVISQAGGREKQGTKDPLKLGYRWFKRDGFEQWMKKLMFPKRLRDSFIYLYMNFFRCLNDPKLFDSIVDLYDAFRTFHSMVESAANRDIQLYELQLKELEDFATALEDACYYRLCLTSPQHELNDMAVHFRGGLNQLLAGSDVLLKAGVGIIKWAASQPDTHQRFKSVHASNNFGAVTELCFAMRPRCHNIHLAKQNGFGLAYLRVNVGHIFHVPEFVYYLHEVGHLFQFLMDGESAFWQMVKDVKNPAFKRAAAEWSKEIFAEAFVHQFVFNGDTQMFLKHYLACHSIQPEKQIDPDCEDRQLIVAERLLVAFYATQLADDALAGGAEEDRLQRHAELLEQFLEVAKQCVYLHAYHEDIDAESSPVWDMARRLCMKVARPILRGSLDEVRYLKDLRLKYFSKLFGIPEDSPEKETMLAAKMEVVDSLVDERLITGKALGESELQSLVENHSDPLLSPILLGCASMIRCFLRRTICDSQKPDKEYHVPRNDKGNLAFAEDRSRYAPFLVDRGFAGMYCTDLKYRAQAVLSAAAIHNSLQGFSMELRRRRLSLMVGGNQTATVE